MQILKLSPSPKNIAKAVTNIRSKNYLILKFLVTVEVFLKILFLEKYKFLKLKKISKYIHFVISENKIKIPAGWLIENIGLKGYRKGDVGIHKEQALVIVNYGNLSGKDILKIAKEVQIKVKENYNIKIEPEVNII